MNSERSTGDGSRLANMYFGKGLECVKYKLPDYKETENEKPD